MNWLRSKLRAWLNDEPEANEPQPYDQFHWARLTSRYRNLRSSLDYQSGQLEQQQREICALRGEIAMLKADSQAAKSAEYSPITGAPRYEQLTGRNWAEGCIQPGDKISLSIQENPVKF